MDDPRFALGFMLGALFCYWLNNRVPDIGGVTRVWQKIGQKIGQTLPQSTSE